MIILFIGNAIALLASLVMVYSGFLKEKKKILFVQTIQIGLFILSNIVLGGITGVINNLLNAIQNILCYKDKLGLREKIIITILSIILSIAFNNMGLIGLLPLISTVLYIWLMNIKDVIKFKILIISTIAMWLIYNIAIQSYITTIFNFATITANCISIYQLKRKRIK